MKAKSLLAMLTAMALSVNFVSCSDDDEPGGGGAGSGDATKRLVKIFVQSPEGDTNNETNFLYDSEGRVSELVIAYDHHHDGIWNDVYTYSYNGNEVVIENVSNYDGEEELEKISTYTLNDKGYAVSGEEKDYYREGTLYDETQYTFNYTDDYLIGIKETFENESGIHTSMTEENQIIADDQILPQDWDAVEYTDIPNKANFFFHYSNEVDIFDTYEFFELYWANLAGKAPKYLPKKVTDRLECDWNFDYKLDDDGYVKQISITDGEGGFNTTITCTYEEL